MKLPCRGRAQNIKCAALRAKLNNFDMILTQNQKINSPMALTLTLELLTHRVAPGLTPSMSQESLLLRIRRMVSACSLVKPTLTSATGRFPPFSHMSVIDEKNDCSKGRNTTMSSRFLWRGLVHAGTHLKHLVDTLTTLRWCLKVMEASRLGPQAALTLVHNPPLGKVHLFGR